MKRLIIVCAIINMAITIFAQSWSSGVNTLYTTPDTTKVGIGIANPTERLHINNGALKIGNTSNPSDRSKNVLKFGDGDHVKIGEWEANDMLSFKAHKFNLTNGNVGIGVPNPQYKLDVNGKVYLRTFEWKDYCAYSYLQWQCHKLVMGVPKGEASVTMLDLMSGGSNSYDSLFSQFTMYTAYGEDNQVAKIQFNTMDNCWINTPGYVGIGTEHPQNKLDVRGSIRANEIYVNNVSGADFVFDEAYDLRPLSEVKEYVQQYQHLPEMPSAAEMQRKGVNMNDLQMQLLQKVEELTLYIIQQEQRIRELELQISK